MVHRHRLMVGAVLRSGRHRGRHGQRQVVQRVVVHEVEVVGPPAGELEHEGQVGVVVLEEHLGRHAHVGPGGRADLQPAHLQVLDGWLRSYRAEELFDESGRLVEDVAALAPAGTLRMSDNPHTNGGLLLKDLRLPDFRDFAVDVPVPGGSISEATRVLGQWLTEVIRLNPDNFRIFGPDETASNRLQAVFDVTDKVWNAEYKSDKVDDHLARLDADACLETELADVIENPQPGPDRAVGVVLMRDGDTEGGHYCVAGEFLDGAAMGLDAALDAVEEARHPTAGDLWILAVQQLRRSDEVRE